MTEKSQSLVGEQRRDRETEFSESPSSGFRAEIEMEIAPGRTTYAEVEESEADLERLEKWRTAIGDRDYFATVGCAEARMAVLRCREALAAFETATLVVDNADDGNSGVADSKLR